MWALALSLVGILATTPAVGLAGEGVLSPQAAAVKSSHDVTVGFRVQSVYITGGEVQLVTSLGLEPNDSFYIVVTPRVQERLKRIGIADLESHFKGRVVQVRGKVLPVLCLSYPATMHYSIAVEDLDQFRLVK